MRWLLAIALVCSSLPTRAQQGSIALSQKEEEDVRDAAAFPAQRVKVFQTIVDTRIERIQAVLADVRAQGRREDIHQNMNEVAGLVAELEDNLEEYEAAHRDLRKPLPKLIEATEKWESVLKQPPDDDTYDITRRLALETVADVKAEAKEMLAAELKYFKEHPPKRDDNPGGVGPVKAPRE